MSAHDFIISEASKNSKENNLMQIISDKFENIITTYM